MAIRKGKPLASQAPRITRGGSIQVPPVRSAAIATIPTRCAVCASPLRNAESRARALGPECAALLDVGDVAPRWTDARSALLRVGVRVSLFDGHWGSSARRVVSRLLVMLATSPAQNRQPFRASIEALGFVTLATLIGSRKVHPRRPKSAEEARRALRHAVRAGALHPDQGGDPATFIRVCEEHRT